MPRPLQQPDSFLANERASKRARVRERRGQAAPFLMGQAYLAVAR